MIPMMSAVMRKMRKIAKGLLVIHIVANLAPQPSGAGTDGPSAILFDIININLLARHHFSCNKKEKDILICLNFVFKYVEKNIKT
jgi:hypothetical protein